MNLSCIKKIHLISFYFDHIVQETRGQNEKKKDGTKV